MQYKKTVAVILASLCGCLLAAGTASAKQDVNQKQSSRKTGYKWDVSKNITFGIGGYVQLDAYNLSNTSGPNGIGTGPGGNKTIDAYFRRAILGAHGKIYSWKYLFAYEFAHSTRNAIIWSWISHKLGPGELYIGQHWTYTSLEEPIPGKGLMFLERDVATSNGLTTLRDHGYGLFYQLSTPFGSGHNNIFWGASAYILRNPVLYGGTHVPRDETTPDAPGWGFNSRIAYAPLVTHDKWYQLGLSASYERAQNGRVIRSGSPGYAGPESAGLLVSTYPTDFSYKDGQHLGDATATRGTLGYAGSFGSLFTMAEYGLSRKHQGGLDTETTESITAAAGYWLTGEITPFARHGANYGVPDPLHRYGAVEVGFRYNHLENLDNGNVAQRAQTANPTCRTAGINADVTQCKLSQYQLVVNYYPNPRLRFAGQLTQAVADLGNAGKDKPLVFELRAQFVF